MRKLILLLCFVTAVCLCATAQNDEPRRVRTTFDGPLGPEWVYIQNPVKAKYSTDGGKLRLTASLSSLNEDQRPTFVGRRAEKPVFTAETRLDFDESLNGDEAGLTVYQAPDAHADLCLRQGRNSMSVALKLTLKSVNVVLRSVRIPDTVCSLRVRSDSTMYYFDYSLDGQKYTTLDKIDCVLLKPSFTGGSDEAVGPLLGMYATLNRDYLGHGWTYAYFDYFEYVEH
jgi:alpha-N-arabinofuranosidase